MKGVDKMRAWLELEAERELNGICNSCFIKTLKMVLSNRILKELKEKKLKT